MKNNKYKPLHEYLCSNKQNELSLTFDYIELLLNDVLPMSARSTRTWWSNRRRGALQATAWLKAGYRVADVDVKRKRVTFQKSTFNIKASLIGNTLLWTGDLVKALRVHMELSQSQFAAELGVRQQTISEWESGKYQPSRATSKHLTLVAQQANFKYEIDS